MDSEIALDSQMALGLNPVLVLELALGLNPALVLELVLGSNLVLALRPLLDNPALRMLGTKTQWPMAGKLETVPSVAVAEEVVE